MDALVRQEVDDVGDDLLLPSGSPYSSPDATPRGSKEEMMQGVVEQSGERGVEEKSDPPTLSRAERRKLEKKEHGRRSRRFKRSVAAMILGTPHVRDRVRVKHMVRAKVIHSHVCAANEKVAKSGFVGVKKVVSGERPMLLAKLLKKGYKYVPWEGG
jgi:hypothetical protein